MLVLGLLHFSSTRLPSPQAEEKELFRTYVEDFNTSTLPHRKFYNLEFYHREKAARARKKGHSEVCFPGTPLDADVPWSRCCSIGAKSGMPWAGSSLVTR